MGEVTWCGGCDDDLDDRRVLLDMGMQPLAEGGDDTCYPLKLIECLNCGLAQLSYVVDQARVFRPDHPYATGNTRHMVDHYRELSLWAAYNILRLAPVHNVVDIGANDGTLISNFPGAYQRIAVEPTDQIDKADYKVIRYKEFFTQLLGRRIREERGPIHLVTACNVLAHVPDPHDFLRGVHEMLDDGGELVTENHDLASVTEGVQFDTIYHEHLRYYTPGTLSRLLELNGFKVISVQPVDTHGGSFRIRARKAQGHLANSARVAADNILRTLTDITHDGCVVYGIGATTRATPLIHYSGIKSLISAVVEVPGSARIGTRIPGTNIPVIDEEYLFENQPEYALLLSWHLGDKIIPKLRARGYRGKFIVPLPEVRIL